ncbi:MAG: replication initiator [Streptosporangiaceae bacterium]
MGPRTRHPPRRHHRGPDRQQGRLLRRQVRHQSRPNAPAPSTAASPPPTNSPSCPSANTPAATSPHASGSASSPRLEHLHLAAWAHMLGYGGHFSTKSRAYSTTLGALRADRAAYQRETAIAAGVLPDLDSDTTLTVTDWDYAGRAYLPVSPYLTAAANGPGSFELPDRPPGGDR